MLHISGTSLQETHYVLGELTTFETVLNTNNHAIPCVYFGKNKQMCIVIIQHLVT